MTLDDLILWCLKLQKTWNSPTLTIININPDTESLFTSVSITQNMSVFQKIIRKEKKKQKKIISHAKKQEKTQSEKTNEMSTPGSDIIKMFELSGSSLTIIVY